MARNITISEGEFYHVYNRGALKNTVFLDRRDYTRFLLIVLLFQSDVSIYNLGDAVTNFLRTAKLNLSKGKKDEILQKRTVKLISFTLMPNHFHLILQSTGDGDIGRYMHRVQMAYSKYFNAKYKKSGHVFQGAYKVVHIEDNEQLLHVLAYVHKNSKELKEWKTKYDQYPWSSLQDYAGESRWGDLLAQDIILEQFDDRGEYLKWVKMSPAKEVDDLGID